MYKDLLDSHTHTIASGHAYNTMSEMIMAAKEKGLELIALTEHAPEMPGTCHAMYFMNYRALPRKRHGIWTLHGAELNILNHNGDVDLKESVLAEMDVLVASIHPPCYHETEDHTQSYLNVMQNPYVNIIGHPDDSRYKADYEKLVAGAKKYHKLLEFNSSSLSPLSYRQGAADNYREMLKWCMEYETPIIIDSDAHMDTEVGNHERAWKVCEEMNFPAELIANTDLDIYFSYLREDTRKRIGV